MREKQRKHLTDIERVKIEALNTHGCSCAEIAKHLGRDRSTIFRELKKGACIVQNYVYEFYETYSAQIGQNHHDEIMQEKAPPLKIGNDIAYANFLEHLILVKNFSPAAALARAVSKGYKTNITKQTLYRYIDNYVFLKLENKHLPSGKRKKPIAAKSLPSGRNLFKRSISERPKSVLSRLDFGHWEMDTVIGKRDGGVKCLLVFTERLTRKEHIIVIKSKTAAAVVSGLNKLRKLYGRSFSRIFKTITCDNGCEFSDDKGIEKKGSTLLYYCHAYASWERGSNENCNKLIRRFIKKGTEIERYSVQFVADVEFWVNDYPRELLGWATADELFQKELAKLANVA